MTRSAQVVVTGTGAVSALGGNVEATWHGILDGRTAVRHWADLAAEGFSLDVACRVDDAVWGDDVPDVRVRGRALARRAAREALADAGLLGADGRLVDGVDPARVGVFVGTTMGESGVYEDSTAGGTFDLAEGGSQVFATSVASAFGLAGPCRTIGTACAAGNYAIGAAARAVASGRVDIALAGGVEPFSRIAMVGFARMRAMAPEGCAPFGLGRRGMTLGEGAAFVVLQRQRGCRRRPRRRRRARAERRRPPPDGTARGRQRHGRGHARRAHGIRPLTGRHRLGQRTRHRHPTLGRRGVARPAHRLRRRTTAGLQHQGSARPRPRRRDRARGRGRGALPGDREPWCRMPVWHRSTRRSTSMSSSPHGRPPSSSGCSAAATPSAG